MVFIGLQNLLQAIESHSGRIRSVTLELHSLEHQKKNLHIYTFKHEYLFRLIDQSWSNFMCSVNGVGERLH